MILFAALTACTPEPGTATGRLLDARGGTPVADAEIVLTAADDRCPAVSTRTDADGAYTVAGLCGEGTWTVAPADPGWYLPEPVRAGLDTELRAWRAAPTPGVYTVSGTEVTPLVTHTALDVVRLFGTDQEVRFPVEIPGVLPRVDADVSLLLVGDVLGEAPRFEPLVPSTERRWFGTKEAPQPVDPWVYLGVRFASDTEHERVEASLQADAIERVGGPTPLRYLGAAALAPGRYALLTEDATRAFLLDFGPEAPTVASP